MEDVTVQAVYVQGHSSVHAFNQGQGQRGAGHFPKMRHPAYAELAWIFQGTGSGSGPFIAFGDRQSAPGHPLASVLLSPVGGSPQTLAIVKALCPGGQFAIQ